MKSNLYMIFLASILAAKSSFVMEASDSISNKKEEESIEDVFPVYGKFHINPGKMEKEPEESENPFYVEEKPRVDFVGTIPNSVKDMIIASQKPEIYERNSGGIPNKLLLYGPPGTGKTTLARLVANQTGRILITVIGGSFVNKYRGSGSKAIKKLFNYAERLDKPCVIFIDEIDGIAGKASQDASNFREEASSIGVLNGYLNNIAGSKKIFFIGATNERGSLNDSIVSKMVTLKVGLPDKNTRLTILRYHIDRRLGLKNNLTINDIEELEGLIRNFSIRDIDTLFNKAIAHSARSDQEQVLPSNLKAALNETYVEIMNNVRETFNDLRQRSERMQQRATLLNERDSELSGIDRRSSHINYPAFTAATFMAPVLPAVAGTIVGGAIIYNIYSLWEQNQIRRNSSSQRQDIDRVDWDKIFDASIYFAEKWLNPELLFEIYTDRFKSVAKSIFTAITSDLARLDLILNQFNINYQTSAKFSSDDIKKITLAAIKTKNINLIQKIIDIFDVDVNSSPEYIEEAFYHGDAVVDLLRKNGAQSAFSLVSRSCIIN